MRRRVVPVNNKLVWVVAVVAVLVLGIGGGLTAALVVGSDDVDSSAPREADPPSSDTGGSTTPDTPTTPVGPVPKGLEEFYTQRLDWQACGDNECAALTVPVD